MNRSLFFSKSNRYLAYLFAFSMSIFVKELPILIGFWILSLIIQAISSKSKILFDINRFQILLLVLYFLYIIGMFWSEDKTAARFALEEKLSLLVFPLLIGFNKDFFKQNYRTLLLLFVLGVIAASLICLFYATWESTSFLAGAFSFNPIDPKFADWKFGGSHFRYISLSLFMHPTYFSIYILFALALTVRFLNSGIHLNTYLLIGLKVAIPLFILMIYLLSSKAVLVSALILLIFFSIAQYRKRSRKRVKLLISVIVIVFISIGFQNPRFESIIKVISNQELLDDTSKDGSFISRIHIWKAGVDLIGQNIFLGVGPGDTNNELVKTYKSYNYIDPYLKKSNAHNQYIETFIDLGIAGFIVLNLVIFFPFFGKRNPLFLIFLFLIGFNFLFESFFNMQAGIVFFGFFYCLLSMSDEQNTINLKL
ncbi:MAG: O-antigen ligase family protein [Bacteroidales bacterium]|nr:O-antigen ligase family protein [Bacteroidales bacterium]